MKKVIKILKRPVSEVSFSGKQVFVGDQEERELLEKYTSVLVLEISSVTLKVK